MMVVDSSALAAVLFGEDDSGVYRRALSQPGRKYMSVVSRLEIAIVVEARKGSAGTKLLADLLSATEIEEIAFDSSLAQVAFDAWRRWGRSRHRAALNLGDCASYALAKVLNQNLLFKGSDFSQTDISSAV